MIEFREDSAAVLDQEFFAESGDMLPTDVAYDAPDKGASEEDASILSDGEGGGASAA